MSEVIRSKVFNAREDKIYDEDALPEQALLWWREVRSYGNGFKVVKVNYDFSQSCPAEALTEMPCNIHGDSVISKKDALLTLDIFHDAMNAHHYTPLSAKAVQKAGIPALTA